jgi:hypothetical protein
VNALVSLSRGLNPGFGPLRVNLIEIIRSLPSVHQLLPTWKCVETPNGYARIDEIDIPDMDGAMVSNASQFHAKILDAAKAGPPSHYRKLALKGIEQPTLQSARLGPNGVEGIESYDGKNFKGDGTVPRLSSHPPEFESDDVAGPFGQLHTTLHSDANLHRQLRAILTADQMEVYASAENLFGVDLPDVVPHGSPLVVTATSATGDTSLPLRAEINDESGAKVASKLLRNIGKGRYEGRFDALPPGLATVTVKSATPGRPLDPVIGMTIVWDDQAALIE